MEGKPAMKTDTDPVIGPIERVGYLWFYYILPTEKHGWKHEKSKCFHRARIKFDPPTVFISVKTIVSIPVWRY